MARRGRPTVEVVLSDDERETLERWARRPKSAQALALRCRIVLLCADGATNTEVVERLGVSHPTVIEVAPSLRRAATRWTFGRAATRCPALD